MIRLIDVWHHYGIRPVLQDVNLHLEAGQLVTVMGPNGMGKSTLLSVIAGILYPIRGRIEIDGRIRRSSIEDETAIRKQLFYLPDSPYVPLNSTGREYVLALGRLYEVDEMRLMEHTEQLIKLFDLAEVADAPIRSYSTGQKKKIGICSALASEAPILVLDEPFSGGLDSSALLALSHILKRLADSKDVTIVMAVPVPELVEPITHKIAIVAHGRILAYDSPEGLRRQTSCEGCPLNEVLEKLIHPEVLENIHRYLEKRNA